MINCSSSLSSVKDMQEKSSKELNIIYTIIGLHHNCLLRQQSYNIQHISFHDLLFLNDQSSWNQMCIYC